MAMVVCFLFVTNELSRDSGIYNIYVIKESHAEIIFMIIFLTIRYLFIEVMVKLTYSLLLIQ